MKLFYNIKIALYIYVCSAIFISCNNNNNQNTKTDSNDSLSILTEQLHKNPNNAALFSKRASLYFKERKLQEAINDGVYAVKIDSLNPKYTVQLCEYYILAAKSEKAKDLLLKFNSLVPDNVDILLKLSELYLFVKQYEDAMKYSLMAQDIDKDVPRIYFLRGIMYQEKGDTANAISNFQTTIDKNPNDYHSYIMLGLLYYNKHDSLAVEYYKTAIKLMPNSIEAHYNIAMFYQENKKETKAIDEYNYIINSIDSTYIYAWYNIGYVNMQYLKNYKEGIKYFDKALKLDSTYIDAIYNKGYCFEMLKDYKKAKEIYLKCKQMEVNYELAINGLNRLDKKR